jgi:hypothetical protein
MHTEPLICEFLRTLDVADAGMGEAGYLSAASALLRVGQDWLVAPDDAPYLGLFPVGSTAPGRVLRVLNQRLPTDAAARKAAKPDFEVLLQLDGAILVMGSGSKATRERGVLLKIAQGHIRTEVNQAIDLHPLYAPLQQLFSDLNIEGAAVWQNQLCLLQRGNQAQPNALVQLPLARFLEGLVPDSKSWEALRADEFRVHLLDVGHIGDVRLTFSDAASLPSLPPEHPYAGALCISAVAENTANSMDDGAFLGAVIALLRPDFSWAAIRRVQPDCKIEGIWVDKDHDQLVIHMLTDADDPAQPAKLLRASL